MSRLGLVRLAVAAALAAGLGAPVLAQSERNSRLLPQAAAPVAPAVVAAPEPVVVPPPVVPAAATEAMPAPDAAAPTVLPGAAASTFSPSPAAGPSDAPPLPSQTAAAPATPAPRALPPSPRPAAVPAAQPAAVAPTPAAAVTTTEAPSQPTAPAPARVRTPVPAVRVAAPAVPAQAPAAEPARSTDAATESASAVDALAEDTETLLSGTVDTEAAAGPTAVAVEAAPEGSATANDALAVMARDAEAMRAAAEQEQAALTVQQAVPRPAPRADTVVEAAEVVAVVEEPAALAAAPVEPAADDEPVVAAEPPVAAVHEAAAEPATDGAVVAAVESVVAVEHETAPQSAAAAATNAAHAAVDGAGPADAPAPPHPPTAVTDGAAQAPAETAPAAAAEHGPAPVAAEPTVAAEAAGGNEDSEGRQGGIRWIAGAGLPPPNPDAPLVAGEPHSVPADTDGSPDEAALDTAAVTAEREVAPRVRRRPSTPPIAAPYELVRTLQAMQDDMAGGSTAALAAQRTLLQRMEEEFEGADPLVWQDRRNARALVAYTLGGGRPVTLRRLLASETPPDGDAALMRGALAYVEGDEATARKYLTDIDAKSLPASLGGQLALAQAALAVGEDPKKAMLLLDTARLLAPGTLVEEGALRRQIFVASELNDLVRFEALSGQYLRRFRRSVYAGNFRRRFAAALSRMEFLDDPAQFHRLDDMLAETDPEARRELYLVVAQAAVNEGKTMVAATAAERALASAPPGSVDEARGRLYRGAALAVTSDGLDAAMSELGRVDRGGLPRTDAALLQAATETAMLIRTAAAAATAGAAEELPVEATPEDETPSATVTRARDAIAAIDTLLEQAQ